ncbi:sulfotransferase [Alteromonas sp. C1M14]|uniref:tetratricopeptide repeat-containing sulfotransferase family protein n=1 Tax=Alteromonas sp. C1M14 TaxID=2841567 RepID=UPI001C0967BA|nr:sulfotransferase [Alteromonas sp. C1M14]MBU2979898.1 sulfotransferase [Alteromonas sp. C1M14]
MFNSANQYYEAVQQHRANNKLSEASLLCTQGLKVYPKSGQLWIALSDISMGLGQSKTAINMALKAIDCEPDTCWHYFHLAGCYLHLQVFAPAKSTLDRARTIMSRNTSAKAWDKLGELYYTANNIDAAINAHRQALGFCPDSVSSKNHLAALLRFKGQLDDAEQLYLDVLRLQPDSYQACYSLSQLRRVKTLSPLLKAIDECEKALPAGHHGHIMLQYAKGKVLEDTGNFDDAFNSYQKGAQLKRTQRPYDVAQDILLMDTVCLVSDALQTAALPSPKADATQTPIFVLGLPRTGTTLVERILDSHPQVTSGGELNAFPMALLEAGGKTLSAGLDGLNADLINALDNDGLQTLANRYLQLANNNIEGATQFVDKLPYNFLYCGFILQAIPNAKIVHVKRNPFDAAISNFKMLFDRGYEYSYDLEDTARFIAAYEQLMENWKQRFPGQIHTVEYEELVKHQHTQTQTLLQFCQLPWADDCLHFHRNSSASQTASASQVREPIYQRSVALWRQFDKHLVPLKNAFAAQGIMPDTSKEQS